jgi:phosphate butyryltransferase
MSAEQGKHVHMARLLAEAEPLAPIPTAVVAPEEADALSGPLLAAEYTLIEPILIGDPGKMQAAAKEIGKDISGYRIVEESNHAAAAARGCALVNAGEARALMKGHLHTDVFLGAIFKRETGLRVGQALSHVFVQDIPGFDRLLMITDAAINIAPDLATKAAIAQNAIHLARSLGVAEPKVAVLAAVEKVNPTMTSTLDAAALSKMADRGQIKGGLVDGPLAMDNALSPAAAKLKGIDSPVAGYADILLVPTIETGNILFKSNTYLAGAVTAGIVLGAKCPVILTSRSDDEQARLASCAVAALYGESLKG